MPNSNLNLRPSLTGLDAQEQLAAMWASVRRHPGIVAISMVACLLLGALYYLKVPRIYESRTQIRVITKNFTVSGDEQEETPTYESTIETHKVVICSRSILELAIKDFALDKLPSLVDCEDPLNVIRDNLDANVKEENTTVLELAYRSSHEADCQKVLQAINDTYEKYLSKQNHAMGSEASDLITNAKNELLTKLTEKDQEYGEFTSTAPLMWREGQGVNIHHERQLDIERARQGLLVERAVLEARIAALQTAIAQGDKSKEALRFEALKELSLDEKYSDWRSLQITEQERFAEREALRQYASLAMGEFVRLEVEASEMLDEFGEGHPKVESIMKRKNRVQAMLKEMQGEQTALSDSLLGLDAARKAEDDKLDYVAIYMQLMRDRKSVMDQQIARLDEEFAAEQKLANVMQKHLLTDQRLRNEIQNTKGLFDVVLQRLGEINILRDAGGDTMTIIEQPQLGEQVAPKLLLVVLGSVLLGSLIGCGVACSLDRAERTFRSVEEIREALDIPVVGCVPTASDRDAKQLATYSQLAPSIFTVHQDGSLQAEAFRGVRTSLYYSTLRQNHKVIQITSPLPGDGKSTLAANLAVAIAKSGKRVLVVDADFRRPMIAKLFGIPSDGRPGLGAVIAGSAELSQALTKTQVDNLYLIPARERPRQPSELLTTPQFAAFLQMVRKQFDFVLVDTPPLLPVTDPSVVAAQVDGVLLTVRIRKGVRVAALRAVEMLRALDANIQGIVVNGWSASRGTHVGRYEYNYGYGEAGSSDANDSESPLPQGANGHAVVAASPKN